MKRIVLLALLSLVAGKAAALDNYYINLGGGGAYPNHNGSTVTNSDYSVYSASPAGLGLFRLYDVKWQNKYNVGYNLNLALGANLKPQWRGEVEFFYQELPRKVHGSYDWVQMSAGDADVFAPQVGVPIPQSSTNVRLYTLLANVYYDFKMNGRLTPFVGLGIGPTEVHSQGSYSTGALTVNDLTTLTSTVVPTVNKSPGYSTLAFAGQVKAGLAFQINKHLALSAEYRFFATTPVQNTTSQFTMNPGTLTEGTFKVQKKTVSAIVTNGFDINIRYAI